MKNVATDAAVGSWTTYRTNLSPEEMNVFKQAMGDIVGVTYAPFAAATQVVAGTNYRFLCNAKGSYPGAPDQLALVQIHQPPAGIPHVTSIRIIE